MPVITEGYAQINWIMGGPALPLGAQMTLGFHREDALVTPSTYAALAQDALFDNLQGHMPSNVTVLNAFVKFGPDATGPSAFGGSPFTGTAGTTTASPNVAYLIKKVTALGGRFNRGRLFMPGVMEANVGANGNIDSGTVTALTDGWNDLMTQLIAGDATPVILHGTAPLPIPTNITEFVCDPVAATQRRRLRH